MIGILDYNAGNISSVLNAFKYLEIDAKRIETLDEVMKMKGIVIPGVGSFPTAYKNMQNIGITRNFLNEYLKKGKILGICLGMQIMYEYGEEDGGCEGYGFFKGSVKRLESGLIVPHMGWNRVDFLSESRLIEKNKNGFNAYFAHSYIASRNGEQVKGSCLFGEGFAALIEAKNIFGVQFHPEKSGENGLRFFKKFGEICYENNSSS